jgi:hypothetical protein
MGRLSLSARRTFGPSESLTGEFRRSIPGVVVRSGNPRFPSAPGQGCGGRDRETTTAFTRGWQALVNFGTGGNHRADPRPKLGADYLFRPAKAPRVAEGFSTRRAAA